MFEYSKRTTPGICAVKWCTNPVGNKTGKLCEKHHKQKFAKNHPRANAYNNLRSSAKRRDIAFTITFDYYCGLLDSVGHALNLPNEQQDWITIDRIDSSRGYEQGNLQTLLFSDNSLKGNREAFLPEHIRKIVEEKRREIEQYAHEEPYSPPPETELDENDPDYIPF